MTTSSTTRRLSALAAASLLSAAVAIPAFAAGPVSVTVNGNPANLNPPPTERAGRVFVPLRGVFEQLGASVVYQSGVINATGRGHSISLKIGSQQATVDGQQQNVDVAPFIIGASTYVPLRFVSQALGATVNYDGSNRVVAINTNGAAANVPANQTITPVPAANNQGGGGAITLVNEQPARGSDVTTRRPTIGATFAGGTADPNSVRVTLDTTDITNDSTRSPRGILFVPSGPLTPGPHRVRVTGTDSNGNPFNRSWAFTTGTSTATAGQIVNVRPANGTTVGQSFIVSGRTTPGARVTIQVGTSNARANTVGGLIGAILGAGGNQSNTASGTVVADANGRFSQQVNINAPSGTQLVLTITATDPQTGASGTPVQETLNIQ
ncbi:MAG TPA: copper amine oxidase N-terminal domain-containing protein [Xanthomonadales bacterium]|nr:copper amine oxidase N-terminal domain-containing protein [Xanthomonadales bacterium]